MRREICVHGYSKKLCPLCKPKPSNPQRYQRAYQEEQLRYLPELERPENARWLALLVDTEGAMGWRRVTIRKYVYRTPYISVGMKEKESKRTVDKASYILGTTPATVKVNMKRRQFMVRYRRALVATSYMKPYLDKFERMAHLLQTLFKYHTLIPKQKFDHVIGILFGKYVTSATANTIMLQMTEQEYIYFMETAEKLALTHLI